MIYVIVHTARTGSHLLASWLDSVGLGLPEEHFTAVTDRSAKLWQLLEQRKDVIAIKGWLDDVSHVWQEVEDVRIIWLRRGDKLRQAISWYRAYESNIWRGGPAGDVLYDHQRIAAAITMFSQQESKIEREIGSLRPLRLWYEDMVAEPRKTIGLVASFLGRTIDLQLMQTKCVRMSDDTTERWIETFGTQVNCAVGSR